MATSVHDRSAPGDQEVRILPPEYPTAHRAGPLGGGPHRPVAWIVAFVVAVVALMAVIVVEQVRISDRDDALVALRADVATMQARIDGRLAVIRDLHVRLAAARGRGASTAANVVRLSRDLAAAERNVARLGTRSAVFEARSGRLSAILSNWVPPVTDGTSSGYLLGVNATADPSRVAFEAVESENPGQWMLLPVSPDVDITVWSYPIATSTKQTEDLAYLDRMFSSDTPWAMFHRTAWYRIIVADGTVTEIHQAAPTP